MGFNFENSHLGKVPKALSQMKQELQSRSEQLKLGIQGQARKHAFLGCFPKFKVNQLMSFATILLIIVSMF